MQFNVKNSIWLGMVCKLSSGKDENGKNWSDKISGVIVPNKLIREVLQQ